VNYACAKKGYHTLDIYVPQAEKPTCPAVISIYGSAWFGNDLKQSAFATFGTVLLVQNH